MTLTRWLTFENAGRLVVFVAVASVAFYIGRGCKPTVEREVTRTVDTTVHDGPLLPRDLVPPTRPSTVDEYEAPDTADTVTDCIRLPSWLSTLRRPYTTNASSKPLPGSDSAMSSGAVSQEQPKRSWMRPGVKSGPRYAITPLTNGSPRLSVESSQVVFSGFLPDGAGRTWTYDVPQERNRIAAYGRALVLPGATGADAGLTYERKTDWGALGVQAGYGVTAEGAGMIIGVTLSTGYRW